MNPLLKDEDGDRLKKIRLLDGLGVLVHSHGWLGMGLGLLTLVTSCANNPDAQSLEQRFAADPQLTNSPESPGLFGSTETPLSSPSPPSRNPSDPVPPSSTPPDVVETLSPVPPITPTGEFPDFQQVPPPLQPYVVSLAKLGVLSTSNAFQPNAVASRREFIRWMVTAQNKIYANRPARQIRLTTTANTPIFKDVPKTDPDFGAIQGAAEAGLIPSPLSGDATAIAFRPNAPLTRETLLLWKVPLDVRRSLPTASVDNVKEVWGFQDAARINPSALRAVLADHQNGDLSNINRAFGYTTLFQPQRSVTRAEAAASLWYLGVPGDGLSADDALQIQTTPTLSPPNASHDANASPAQPTVSPADSPPRSFGPTLVPSSPTP